MKIHLVTSNLIEKDGKYLLVQEGHQHAYGQWNFPAGKLEDGLTLEENAIKEAKEESGFNVKIKGLIGVYQDIREDANVVLFVFASEITGGKMRDTADEEIIQAKWLTYDEISEIKNLRGWYIIKAIDDYEERGIIEETVVKTKE